MKKAFVILFAMAMSLVSVAQTTETTSTPQKGLFSGREKYGWIEGKLGRAFTQMGETTSEGTHVFYGGAGIGVGVVMNKTKVGIGAAFECVDLLDKSFSFPLFVELRQYFGKNPSSRFFLGAKGGWILGGKKSFLIQKDEEEGIAVRSMQGPYGEVMVGYQFQRFDFFVSYNYRAVQYNTNYPSSNESWKRSVHVVMGGLSFRVF